MSDLNSTFIPNYVDIIDRNHISELRNKCIDHTFSKNSEGVLFYGLIIRSQLIASLELLLTMSIVA